MENRQLLWKIAGTTILILGAALVIQAIPNLSSAFSPGFAEGLRDFDPNFLRGILFLQILGGIFLAVIGGFLLRKP